MTDTTPVVPTEAPAPTGAAPNATQASVQDSPSAAPAGKPKAEDALKVFAGNLSFSTSEEDLLMIFREAGTITSAQVIKRGSRHLGYGFVTFSTPAEATKAIQLLNDKEIEGRKIAVQAVKPEVQGGGRKGDGDQGTKGKGKNRNRKGAASRRPRIDDGEEEGGATNGADGSQSKPRKGRGKKGGSGEDSLGTPASGAAPNANGSSGSSAAATNDLGTPASGVPKTTKPRASRPQRSGPKGAPEGPPSQTLLFVANLPFEILKEEQLCEIFQGCKIKTATVARQPYGRRSKGYAFVDFESHEEQQKALKEFQGKEVHGREISLKVANEDERRRNKESADAAVTDAKLEEEKAEEAPAAAASA
ncbi:RNA-binding domain-containing protein [Tilletiaria anomala UBC 951]|uniref:RNA-binding domain-containing protein n=1 Tax=Tilletiaria anomala (strain ATCC 24038 / CBS 436.72 / UBC 951) TaxID=1037660 RepID=A0A066VQ38_TILAU|nr:RNA-binding domain-containing protein [Tilletiaria anomala UBC 951]KDN40889.1 RNA-binding domain-containing protein [Tilletiaria anomala UBC 951]